MKYFTKDRYVLDFIGKGKAWYFKSDDKDKEYLDYKEKNLPKWYNEFSIHDDQIKGTAKTDDKFIISIATDDYKHTRYQLVFYNPNIIESCDLTDAWCSYDELYINDNSCEYHLMVMDSQDNSILNYFTIECSNMELIINNKSFKVFNNTEFGSIWDGVYTDDDEID